jgi:hypothetical protein
LPARQSIYTGRRIFPSDLILQRDYHVKIRGWHPLFAEDVTLSETLKGAGYTTAVISDIYHQFKPDKNFQPPVLEEHGRLPGGSSVPRGDAVAGE